MANDLTDQIDAYFKSTGQGVVPSNQKVSTAQLDNFLKPPIVSSSQAGLNAGQNIVGIANQTGVIPTGNDVLSAAKEAQNQAQGHNLNVIAQEYSRQQDILGKGGYLPNAKVPIDKENADHLANSYAAFQSIEHLRDSYNNAYGKSFAFGTPGADMTTDIKYLDPKRQNWEQQKELTQTNVMNGILPMLPGADAKQSAIDKVNKVMPQAWSNPEMFDQSLINLKQTALDYMKGHRASLGNDRPGLDTSPMDQFINDKQREINKDIELHNLKYNSPENSGQIMSSSDNDFLDRASGKPQPSPVSAFSPGSPGMPANISPSPARPGPLPSPNG